MPRGLSGLAISNMKKAMGANSMGRADRKAKRQWRIPTGVFDLDYATGGGIAAGGNIMFFGDRSGGKTTSAMRVVGEMQKLCRNCYRPAKNLGLSPPEQHELDQDEDSLWHGTGECDCYATGIYKPDTPAKETGEKPREYRERCEAWEEAMQANSYEETVVAWIDMETPSFDIDWAQKLGIVPERLLLIRPESAENALDIIMTIMSSEMADLMVIDSIAQLTPKKEVEATMEEWQQGLQARLVNKGIRRMSSKANTITNSGRAFTQIWINQTREKIGVMFGSNVTKPGGKGQEFACHAEIKFRHGKTETAEEQYGNKDQTTTVPVWEEFKIEATKGKAGSGIGTLGIKGDYRQSMRDKPGEPAGTVLDFDRIRDMALFYLVQQEKKGSASTYEIEDRKYTSKKAFAEDLRSDKELYARTRERLLRRILDLS